ncbi:trypsin-like peptidase domain-containing protein [soil metagenome]
MASFDRFPPRQPPPPRSSYTGTLILLGVALGLGLYWYYPTWRARLDPNATSRAITPRDDLTALEKTNIEIYENTLPSVVNITSMTNREDFFGFGSQDVQQGTGSGFVWDDQGRIVTNFHVIQNSTAQRVTMSDQTTYDASVVGAFPDKDLAVLQISAPGRKLRPIPIGTSSDLRVGQRVYAIGNPFGLDGTFTDGIISSLGRQIESVTRRPIRDVIQTNAAINPGNSGGPLIDSAGRLIGVNTAIYSPTGTSAGIGFAIPVDEVNRIVPELIRHGKVVRPDLGVQLAEDAWSKARKIDGVMIWWVRPGGPAEAAGLKGIRRTRRGAEPGDIITAVDGKTIHNREDLYTQLEKHAVGEKVTLNIQRGDESLDVEVTLGQSAS